MRTLRGILFGLAAFLLLLVGWGLIEPSFIDVEEHRAEIPNLPPAWEGRRFAQISDWQIGMWMDNDATVRRCVERLIEERPAFVVISGDLVYHAADDPDRLIREAVELARPLPEAGIPTFAVLGNHDYAMKRRQDVPDEQLARRLASALEEVGVDVLQNEARLLPLQPEDAPPDGGPSSGASGLYLVGIGAHWPGKDRPEVALASVPEHAARVVVMHNPDTFEALPAGTAPLALAGHTHGGQISLPFLPDWSYLTFAKQDEVHADGWAEDAYGRPGNRMYVNRGIGFSIVPLRIHCMPEITLFTLASAKG